MLFATYNIHYGVGADGRYDTARTADVLADTDIACLQEVVRGWPQNGYADQTAEIGRRLNRYYRFHGPMEADASTVDAEGRITSRRRSFGNAILSRWPAARLHRGGGDGAVGADPSLLRALEPRRSGTAPAAGRGAAGRGA